jgi:hypothetical protein
MTKTARILGFCLALAVGSFAQSRVIIDALKDELARSMDKLRLENEAGPYFLSYLLKDNYALAISANSGAITGDQETRSRVLRIDLRVGDYDLDNSNFISTSSILGLLGSMGGRTVLDDDYGVLRRQIWIETDRAYKAALDTLTKKKAALQNTVRTETIPDFTKSEPLTSVLAPVALEAKRTQWEKAVSELAKVFLGEEKVLRSKVDFRARLSNAYYVNSEGTTSVQPAMAWRLVLSASSQADDGMPLKNVFVYTGSSPADVPDVNKIQAEVKRMIADLLALRSAPILEDYNGPVLFEKGAAAEVMAQGLVNFLVTRKMPLSDNPQVSAMLGLIENPFQSRVETRVLPVFLSVKASPSLKTFDGQTLLGSYAVDDEGVKAQDVNLVENGILKSLLTSRSPVKGFLPSNGHGRGGSALPSVIQVVSSRKSSAAELKSKLLETLKDENLPYGYIVRSIIPPSEAVDPEDFTLDISALARGTPDPSQFVLTKPVLAFKVYPDGKEELVRGAEFGSISVAAFKNILGTSEDIAVADFPLSGLPAFASSIAASLLGSGAFPAGDAYATVITPSILVPGIDLKKPSGRYSKPPIVGYPLVKK